MRALVVLSRKCMLQMHYYELVLFPKEAFAKTQNIDACILFICATRKSKMNYRRIAISQEFQLLVLDFDKKD